jgi:hypothetical protein
VAEERLVVILLDTSSSLTGVEPLLAKGITMTTKAAAKVDGGALL